MTDTVAPGPMVEGASSIDTLASSASYAQPTQAEIDAFAYQMEYAKVSKPQEVEQLAVERFQSVEANLTSDLLDALPFSGTALSPSEVLQAQKKIQHGVHMVDLSAKVLGSVSQSINKLLSMQ